MRSKPLRGMNYPHSAPYLNAPPQFITHPNSSNHAIDYEKIRRKGGYNLLHFQPTCYTWCRVPHLPFLLSYRFVVLIRNPRPYTLFVFFSRSGYTSAYSTRSPSTQARRTHQPPQRVQHAPLPPSLLFCRSSGDTSCKCT